MSVAQLITPPDWQLLSDSQLQNFIAAEFGADRKIIAAAKPKSSSSAFAVLEYRPIGYVDIAGQSGVNANAVASQIQEDLQILSNEMQLSASEAIRWKGFVMQPKFRPQEKTLDYGIAVSFGTDVAINLYRVVLIKNGVVVLTIVCNPQEQASLDNSWQVKISPEYAYANYRAGVDSKAEGNLDNIILMNEIL